MSDEPYVRPDTLCWRDIAYRYAKPGTRCPVLLVGEDNPQSSEPHYALFPYPEGCAGHRLAEHITGMGSANQLATWRTNLCNPRWSTPKAVERAHDLLFYADRPWTTIVALGKKVADAFQRVLKPSAPELKLEPFTAHLLDMRGRYIGPRKREDKPLEMDITLVSIPHPSGRNRIWNDPSQSARAKQLLALAAPTWFGWIAGSGWTVESPC